MSITLVIVAATTLLIPVLVIGSLRMFGKIYMKIIDLTEEGIL